MKLSGIKTGRTIHISEDLNIPDGTEITIEISEPQVPITGSIDSDKTIAATAQQRSLVSFIGSAQGLYSSTREIDDFIRQERDQWES